VAKGQHIETFLVTFLSYSLLMFVLPVIDVGCLHSSTFKIESFMALDTEYCSPTTIFVGICKNSMRSLVVHILTGAGVTFLSISSMHG